MKKKYLFVVVVLAFILTVINLFNQNTQGRVGLILNNIEAFAASNEGEGNTCPNGGQKTRGEAENKQWRETHTTDREGKVVVHGQTLNFGLSSRNQTVSFYCYSVECPGSKLDCFLCNVWCKVN